MVKNGDYVFMVANTGPLINTFGELFSTDDEKEKSKIQLINISKNCQNKKDKYLYEDIFIWMK